MDALRFVIDPAPFMPHGMCLLWDPVLIWLHLLSDGAIGLAYFSIPVALVVFARRRRDLAYKWMFLLFGAFIFACGTTHFFGAWTLWNANYVAEGLVKGFTAIVSIATATLLWPLIPRALALPSPAALRQANDALSAQITERIRAEADVRHSNARLNEAIKALRASEARYAGIVNNAADAIFVLAVEPDGTLRYAAANPVLLRLLERGESGVIGAAPQDILSAEASAMLERQAGAAIRTRAPVQFETQDEVSGRRQVFQTLLAPVLEPESGAVVQIIGTVRDLTAYRALQQDLAQAAKLATLGTMAAGVAHEVSQPLNAIRITATDCVEVLAETAPDLDYVREGLVTIRDQSARMGGIVDQMRQFGRRETREPGAFDPAEPVRRAVALLERSFASEDVALTLAMPDRLPPVQGQPNRLEQVVINLLTNARDAIGERRQADPAGPPGRIHLSAAAEGAAVRILVEDNGTGLSPEAAAHLFDPFFTTKDGDKGMGLGLSICASIVGGMGGRIEGHSRPGGASFSITLPQRQDPGGHP